MKHLKSMPDLKSTEEITIASSSTPGDQAERDINCPSCGTQIVVKKKKTTTTMNSEKPLAMKAPVAKEVGGTTQSSTRTNATSGSGVKLP